MFIFILLGKIIGRQSATRIHEQKDQRLHSVACRPQGIQIVIIISSIRKFHQIHNIETTQGTDTTPGETEGHLLEMTHEECSEDDRRLDQVAMKIDIEMAPE